MKRERALISLNVHLSLSVLQFSVFFLSFLFFLAVTMSAAALVGDQIILEELYDETYTPTEQGRQG